MSKKVIKISRKDAFAKIDQQIKKGSILAEEGAKTFKNSKGRDRRVDDNFENKLEIWVNLTTEVLDSIFISTDYAYEFKKKKSSQIEYVSSNWQPDIKYWITKELIPKIDYLNVLRENIHEFEFTPEEVKSSGVIMKPIGKVFIGHGHSIVWKELKDFLQDRLNLKWEEFNREPTAGLSTIERLQEMMDNSGFAFIIMTAEDEHKDGNKHARENVIHEVGLLQGKLGFRKAIILIEEGCAEFSNIFGLGQIRFPKGKIESKFEEIRRVLEREKII